MPDVALTMPDLTLIQALRVEPDHAAARDTLSTPLLASAPPSLRAAASAYRTARNTLLTTAGAGGLAAETQALAATVTSAWASGKQPPADLVQRAAEADRLERERTAHLNVLVQATAATTAELIHALDHHAAEVITGSLTAELTRIHTGYLAAVEAAEGRRFGEVENFVEAPQSARDALFTVRALAKDYVRLREVHLTWLRVEQLEGMHSGGVLRLQLAAHVHEVPERVPDGHWPAEPVAAFQRAMVNPWCPTSDQMNQVFSGLSTDLVLHEQASRGDVEVVPLIEFEQPTTPR